MQDKKPSLLLRLGGRASKAHAGLLALIAAYFIYMAWQMLQNTLGGSSTMSLRTTALLAGVMVLLALLIFAYAALVYVACRRREREEQETQEETTTA